MVIVIRLRLHTEVIVIWNRFYEDFKIQRLLSTDSFKPIQVIYLLISLVELAPLMFSAEVFVGVFALIGVAFLNQSTESSGSKGLTAYHFERY